MLIGKLLNERESDPTIEYTIYNKEIMIKDEANAIKEGKKKIYRKRQAKASAADKSEGISASPDTTNQNSS